MDGENAMADSKDFICQCGRNQRIFLSPKVLKKKCMYCGTIYTLDAALGEGGAPPEVAVKPVDAAPNLREDAWIIQDVEYHAPGLLGKKFVGILAFDREGVVYACVRQGTLPRGGDTSYAAAGAMQGGLLGLAVGAAIDSAKGPGSSGISYFSAMKRCRRDTAERILDAHPGSFDLPYAKIDRVVARPSHGLHIGGKPLVISAEGTEYVFQMAPNTAERIVRLFHELSQVEIEAK
ncbi:MAG: hypothetical protein HY720_11615 [Planctomycetes bacterium]|nr:hypothetical protein [Planctomycetota bacterium]